MMARPASGISRSRSAPQPRLDLRGLVGEILFPPRAEIDVPPPEPPDERLGVPVIMRPQLAGLTGVSFCLSHVFDV